MLPVILLCFRMDFGILISMHAPPPPISILTLSIPCYKTTICLCRLLREVTQLTLLPQDILGYNLSFHRGANSDSFLSNGVTHQRIAAGHKRKSLSYTCIRHINNMPYTLYFKMPSPFKRF